MKIGIDLDNTIICYDNAFVHAAKIKGLLPEEFIGNKQQVRDHIRTLENGEQQWQPLQGYVYGKGIDQATLFDGVMTFITDATRAGHELYIISHKTEHGHFDPDKINLRDAAIAFLDEHGFFDKLGFLRPNISFHNTRKEKVGHIAKINPAWFIDDLPEVYEEPNFPPHIRKILFSSDKQNASPHWQCAPDWHSIHQQIL